MWIRFWGISTKALFYSYTCEYTYVCIYVCMYACMYVTEMSLCIHMHGPTYVYFSSAQWGRLEVVTPQQWPSDWSGFLNTIPQWKKPGLLGEVIDSRAEAGKYRMRPDIIQRLWCRIKSTVTTVYEILTSSSISSKHSVGDKIIHLQW